MTKEQLKRLLIVIGITVFIVFAPWLVSKIIDFSFITVNGADASGFGHWFFGLLTILFAVGGVIIAIAALIVVWWLIYATVTEITSWFKLLFKYIKNG